MDLGIGVGQGERGGVRLGDGRERGDQVGLVAHVAERPADQARGEELTPRHRYRVASHSKVFTSSGIMKLREQGKIDAVGVSNYLPSQVAALQAHLPFPLASIQPEFSPLAIEPLSDGVLDQALERDMAVSYLSRLVILQGMAPRLGAHLPFLGPDLREDVLFLLHEFVAIVESFFRGQLIIGLIMGVLLAIGFSVIGLNFGLFIGLALGVLNIVPYLGTILGLAGALPLAFLHDGGGWTLVGLVLLVKVIVQAIEGWFLTPKIMGERTGLHPVAIMVAIFFWGTAFGGVLGMLLAIPLTAFFVTAWRLARRKYFQDEPPAAGGP